MEEQEAKLLGEDNMLRRYRKELVAHNTRLETRNTKEINPILLRYNEEVQKTKEKQERIAKSK